MRMSGTWNGLRGMCMVDAGAGCDKGVERIGMDEGEEDMCG